MLALGPVVSLVGILLSGAPLLIADTWLRAGSWLLLTGIYGLFWLSLRRRELVYWMSATVYVVLVVLAPGLALATAGLILPAPSRLELAARTQAALRPAMAKTSRELAPFYESSPEFAEGGATPADYDRVRLAAEEEWREAVEPLRQQAEAGAAAHRMADPRTRWAGWPIPLVRPWRRPRGSPPG